MSSHPGVLQSQPEDTSLPLLSRGIEKKKTRNQGKGVPHLYPVVNMIPVL